MTTLNRRDFLGRGGRTSLGLAAGTAILANAQSVRATPANDKVTLGLIGVGGRGSALCDGFLERDDCRIGWVADVDIHRAERTAAAAAKRQGGTPPQAVQDFRNVLDDKSVDAVVIATPDHWHAPAAVWAARRARTSTSRSRRRHNCWEGRKMVEAARKYRRIVQVGTQNRSAAVQHGRQAVHRGGQAGPDPLLPHLQPERVGQLPAGPRRRSAPGLRLGHVERPGAGGPLQRQPTSTTGTTSGAIRAATSPTTPATRSTWPAGCWASIIPSRSIPPAGGFDSPAPRKRPTRRRPSGISPAWCVNFELTLYTPYMLKISPMIREATDRVSLLAAVRHADRDLRQRGADDASAGTAAAGRSSPGRNCTRAWSRTRQRAASPTRSTRRTSCDCIRTRKPPNADVEEGHRSALWIHFGQHQLPAGRPEAGDRR